MSSSAYYARHPGARLLPPGALAQVGLSLTLTPTPTPTLTPTLTQAEMAAQAAVRLQSAGLALMRGTHAGQDVLDHDAGPMRMQAAARSIQRLYRLGARL